MIRLMIEKLQWYVVCWDITGNATLLSIDVRKLGPEVIKGFIMLN